MVMECIESGTPVFGIASPGIVSPQDCSQSGRNGGGGQFVSSSALGFPGGFAASPSVATVASAPGASAWERGACITR